MTREELAARLYVEAADLLVKESESESGPNLREQAEQLQKKMDSLEDEIEKLTEKNFDIKDECKDLVKKYTDNSNGLSPEERKRLHDVIMKKKKEYDDNEKRIKDLNEKVIYWYNKLDRVKSKIFAEEYKSTEKRIAERRKKMDAMQQKFDSMHHPIKTARAGLSKAFAKLKKDKKDDKPNTQSKD